MTLAPTEICSGCSACKAICPKGAIRMVSNDEGFLYHQIDKTRCIECRLCERVCPVINPYATAYPNVTCYAERTKDYALRIASSSGGIFSELAQWAFSMRGIVFGCAWERPTLVAIHAKAESEAELADMRGSKYVQSDLRNTFREVRSALQADKTVLFSGTPCQIAGLNHFLGKAYERLLTVEIICHGVPSPSVFEKYKSELIQCFKSPLMSISFRNKTYSWRKCSLLSIFADNNENLEDLYSNRYIQAFLNDLCLRPSCYQCAAKGGRSHADITIADFWGIERICPELDDDFGTSAVVLHTEKARKVWDTLTNIDAKPVHLNDIVQGNPSYRSAVAKPKSRAYFMRYYKKRPMSKLVTRCLHGVWGVWMLKCVLKKIRKRIKKVFKR